MQLCFMKDKIKKYEIVIYNGKKYGYIPMSSIRTLIHYGKTMYYEKKNNDTMEKLMKMILY